MDNLDYVTINATSWDELDLCEVPTDTLAQWILATGDYAVACELASRDLTEVLQ